MKTIWGIRAVILITMLYAIGKVTAGETGANRDADHAALRALMTNVTEAVNNQDVDKLVTYFAKEFVFTAVDQTVLTNAASIKEFYNLMLSGKNSPVKSMKLNPTADVLTRFLDDNTGYCYGISDDAYTLRRNGRAVTMTSRWTAVVVKENGQWKIAAVHAGVNFLNNPVLDAKTMSIWRKLLLGLGFGKYPGEK